MSKLRTSGFRDRQIIASPSWPCRIMCSGAGENQAPWPGMEDNVIVRTGGVQRTQMPLVQGQMHAVVAEEIEGGDFLVAAGVFMRGGVPLHQPAKPHLAANPCSADLPISIVEGTVMS